MLVPQRLLDKLVLREVKHIKDRHREKTDGVTSIHASETLLLYSIDEGPQLIHLVGVLDLSLDLDSCLQQVYGVKAGDRNHRTELTTEGSLGVVGL